MHEAPPKTGDRIRTRVHAPTVPAVRDVLCEEKKPLPDYVNDDYRNVSVRLSEGKSLKVPWDWEIHECRPSNSDPEAATVILRRAKRDATCAGNVLRKAAQYFKADGLRQTSGRYSASLTFLAGKLEVGSRTLETWLLKAGVADSRVAGSFDGKPAFSNGMVFWLQQDSVLRLSAKVPDRHHEEEYKEEPYEFPFKNHK